MLLIRKKAFARAGLVGNPSDGYHGKTISLVIPDFWAEATLYEWDQVEVVWSQEDHSRFDSVDELVRDVRLHGYYGGVRLVKATIKKFVDYCRRQGHRLQRAELLHPLSEQHSRARSGWPAPARSSWPRSAA